MINIIHNTDSDFIRNIFNIWITGEYPENWKVAKVALIPKDGKDPRKPNRYVYSEYGIKF